MFPSPPEPDPRDAAPCDVDALLADLGRRGLAAQVSFEELHRRLAGRLWVVAWNVVRNRHDADEIAQEAWLKVCLNAPRFDPREGKGVSWILRIAENAALDRLRRRKRRDEVVDEGLAERAVAADDSSGDEGSDWRKRLLAECLQTLADRDRHLLELTRAGETIERIVVAVGLNDAQHAYDVRRRATTRLKQCAEQRRAAEGADA